MLQVGGQALDLVLRLAQGVLQLNDALHGVRLGQQGQQPLLLGALGGQPGLGVVVGLAHVLAALGAPDHIAQSAGLVQEGAEILLGQPDHIVSVPGRVLVPEAAPLHLGGLEVPAGFRHQRLQGGRRRVKGLGLNLQLRPADQLGVLPRLGGGLLPVCRARLAGGAVLGVLSGEGEALPSLGAAGGCGIPSPAGSPAAGGEGEGQQGRQPHGHCSFHLASLLSSGPNTGIFPSTIQTETEAAGCGEIPFLRKIFRRGRQKTLKPGKITSPPPPA